MLPDNCAALCRFVEQEKINNINGVPLVPLVPLPSQLAEVGDARAETRPPPLCCFSSLKRNKRNKRKKWLRRSGFRGSACRHKAEQAAHFLETGFAA
jgi:hypothetical protein